MLEGIMQMRGIVNLCVCVCVKHLTQFTFITRWRQRSIKQHLHTRLSVSLFSSVISARGV